MKGVGRVATLAAAMVLFGAAKAGHESAVYPSYYPQEIRIVPTDPATAGRALGESRIQAYVGAVSGFPAGAENSVAFVESLDSYLVVRVNPDSPLAQNTDARCALAQRVISAIAHDAGGFRYHPYPVNPLHADYLHQFDLAAEARSRFGRRLSGESNNLKIRASGSLAERIVRTRWMRATGEWDAAIEEVSLDGLLATTRYDFNGWMGPPWVKEGWFHAHLLLAPALPDSEHKRAEADVTRLQRGEFQDSEERINLERSLVKLLTSNCRTVVAGYGLQRWHYGADYSSGVENIAFDSHAGFRSAIFIRTVKLKDFPWNGWLALGVPDAPTAAWNPLGGFTDQTGRLIWLTLGDPALFPEPYNSGWNLNRIGDVKRPTK
jgi:hypothetical protein